MLIGQVHNLYYSFVSFTNKPPYQQRAGQVDFSVTSNYPRKCALFCVFILNIPEDPNAWSGI